MKTLKTCLSCLKDIKRERGRQFCTFCAKQRRLQRNRIAAQKRRDEFAAFKISLGCSLCGYNKNAAALDFHHTDPSTKINKRGIYASNWKKKERQKEMESCILVCKNCHAEIHNQDDANIATFGESGDNASDNESRELRPVL